MAELPQAATTSFGLLLREYRQARGLTQEDLAARARMSARAVSDLERGLARTPRRDSVRLLADALDLGAADRLRLEVAAGPRHVGTQSSVYAETAQTGLPIQLTSFVGRQREVQEATALLAETRLLTLLGPGGVGKTRLAHEAAAEAALGYPDGVRWVELAPLTDPLAVPRAVAAALGLSESDDDTLNRRLQAAVRARQMLLVLDNCEHLLDACAALLDQLLRVGEHLRVLVTSREALMVAGEVTWTVPPLALPAAGQGMSPSALAHSDAVRLFTDRARAIQPHFALSEHNAHAVVEVCSRLDGLPLALELAAARLRGLSVAQLARRLDQRFMLLTGGSRSALPRQQTLRATVAWSYSLLTEAEQHLFNRLSVFAGGFTVEAAEAVCTANEIGAPAVLDLLLRLVEKSLVIAEDDGESGTRYRMLETLRQYGRERLDLGGDLPALRTRHTRYYLALAEQAEPLLFTSAQTAWLDCLEREHANITAALAWSLDGNADQCRVDASLRVVGALDRFWLRGRCWEGRRWLRRALERAASSSPATRAKALHTLGALLDVTGDCDEGRAMVEASVAIYRTLELPRELSYALSTLGYLLRNQEPGIERGRPVDYARGTALLEECLMLAREARSPWHRACAVVRTASSIDLHDEAARAQAGALLAEHMTLLHQVGDTAGLALYHRVCGWIALCSSDPPRARASFSEELVAARLVGQRAGVAMALNNLGEAARMQTCFNEAKALYEQALAIYWELDFDRDLMARVIRNLAAVALERADLVETRERVTESLRVSQQLGARGIPQIAGALEVLAGLAAVQPEAERALRLAGAASGLRAMSGQPRWPHDDQALMRWLEPARRALTEECMRTAWHTGETLPLESCIALALDEE